MRASECNTIEELMAVWKSKADHQNQIFVSDGFIDKPEWDKSCDNKKVLFVLKEAHDKKAISDWSLPDDLRERKPLERMWKRVCEWVYAIRYTTAEHIEAYPMLTDAENTLLIKSIAVMNIKKSNGKSSSNPEEISAYADADKEEIIREIELIDPDIIVCGSTFHDVNRIVNRITDNQIEASEKAGSFAYSKILGGRERLFINFYHPANFYPPFMNYYGIAGVYQQALKAKANSDY